MNAYTIVADFERTVSRYTGAPYGVAVDSCTNALFLACKYLEVETVTIPKRTYVSVPQSIIHAGGRIKFDSRKWIGAYWLRPYPICDAARRFSRGMYGDLAHQYSGSGEKTPKLYICVSFHGKKILPIGRGGMILTDDSKARDWFKKARLDGRTEGVPVAEDEDLVLGYHMSMMPEQAAVGLRMMMFLKDYNADLTDKDPDLSKIKIFKPWVEK